MFPNLGRDAVVQALQRRCAIKTELADGSDYNTALAVESLLEQNT